MQRRLHHAFLGYSFESLDSETSFKMTTAPTIIVTTAINMMASSWYFRKVKIIAPLRVTMLPAIDFMWISLLCSEELVMGITSEKASSVLL
jgi:hypothetical protein